MARITITLSKDFVVDQTKEALEMASIFALALGDRKAVAAIEKQLQQIAGGVKDEELIQNEYQHWGVEIDGPNVVVWLDEALIIEYNKMIRSHIGLLVKVYHAAVTFGALIKSLFDKNEIKKQAESFEKLIGLKKPVDKKAEEEPKAETAE